MATGERADSITEIAACFELHQPLEEIRRDMGRALEKLDQRERVQLGIALGILTGTDSEDGPAFVLLSELVKRPELLKPPHCVVPRLAYRGRLVLLAGAEKSGKSTLLGCAVSELSQGDVFLGQPMEPGRVAWVGLEEHPGDSVLRFHKSGAHGDSVQMVMPEARNLFAAIRELIVEWEPDLLVIDSLAEYARVVSGKSPESGDASGWGNVLRPLVALAREYDVAIVVLHHARRSDGKYRDSSEIGAAADAILEMQMPSKNEDPTIRHIKGRGRWHVAPFDVAYREGEYSLSSGDQELSLDTLLIMHIEGTPGINQAELSKKAGKQKQRVVAALTQLVKRGVIENRGQGKQNAYYRAPPQQELKIS